MGSKKRPYFRVVVTDSRAARDSSFVEVLGSYDPRARPERFEVDHARVQHWLGAGARPSNSVRTLLARHPAPPPAEPAAGAAPEAVGATS
jgi:small subunit ribosomal protein S16